jgi:hypothetical protein
MEFCKNIDCHSFLHYNGVVIATDEKRRHLMKKILVLILAVSLCVASVPAFAGTENDGSVIGDILFARPLGIAGIAAGAGLFIISLPFAAITGCVDKTARTLVVNPVKFTFDRPVGDFDYSVDAGGKRGDQ